MRGFLAMSLAAFVALSTMAGLSLPAAAADEMSEERVRQIVEQLLRERPEIIVEAITAYQQQQELAKQAAQRNALSARAKDLYERPGDPFIGNPDAPITLVEFFDYRCGYCKRVLNDVVAVVEANDDVKVVFKEFPILGEASVIASRVALAVNLVAPEKYGEFHKKAMSGRGSYSESALLQLADAMGIDAAAVKAKINSDEVSAAIIANHELAEQLGIRGTPAFVIGGQVIPGAISRSALEQLIKQQRG